MMRHTLTISTKEGGLIDLKVIKGNARSDGFWHIDTNTLVLGLDLFEEWESIMGNSEAQNEFLKKLKQVSNVALPC
jgi:hypothetical protein